MCHHSPGLLENSPLRVYIVVHSAITLRSPWPLGQLVVSHSHLVVSLGLFMVCPGLFVVSSGLSVVS